jgi:hypothetical protein
VKFVISRRNWQANGSQATSKHLFGILTILTVTPIAPFIPTPIVQAAPPSTAAKPDALAAILQQETALLQKPQTSYTAVQMASLYRQAIADSVAFYSHRSAPVIVPSAETTVYFGDLAQRHPESGILAILFAESVAAQPKDFGQVDGIYQDAIKAHPHHPLLAPRYADYRRRQALKVRQSPMPSIGSRVRI